jgi:hypothetical protein
MAKLFLHLSFLRAVAVVTLASFLAATVDLPFLLHQKAYATPIDSSSTAPAPDGVESTVPSRHDLPRQDVLPPEAAEKEVGTQAPRSSVHPHRLLLAKLSTPAVAVAPMSAVVAGATVDVAALLAEAERLRTEKDYAGAVDAYLEVVESSPASSAGHIAAFSAISMLKGLDNTVLDTLEPTLPDSASLTTPEAKLVVGNYYQVRGKRAKNAGNTTESLSYFSRTKSMAWDAMVSFPDSPIQVLAVDGFISAAEEEGAEALDAAIGQMEGLIGSQGENFTTWSCHLLLANYLAREHRHEDVSLHYKMQQI